MPYNRKKYQQQYLLMQVDIPDNSITAAKIVDGVITIDDIGDDAVGVAELSATGTASSTTYLRGDNSWATVSAGVPTTLTATSNIGFRYWCSR